MKLNRLFTAAIAAMAFTFSAFAQEETPLDKEMEAISKAAKLIKRKLPEAGEKAANIERTDSALKACAAAVKLEPKMTKDIPAGEKEKFLADYKAAMEEMGKDLTALKAALEADKTADAEKILEKLNEGKKAGHKKFKSEE